jgi:hypothetical protein
VDRVAPLIAWLLVILTVTLAVLFGRQQIHVLRASPANADLPAEDQAYLHRQAWRRLTGCGILVAMAGMLSFWYLTGLDVGIDQFGDAVQARRAAGKNDLTPEQMHQEWFFAGYWIAFLLLLLSLVILMGIDLNAIRRYATRHSQKIRDDRRAMIQHELAALRRERTRQRDDPSVN